MGLGKKAKNKAKVAKGKAKKDVGKVKHKGKKTRTPRNVDQALWVIFRF